MISVLVLSNSVNNRMFIKRKLENQPDITLVLHKMLSQKSLETNNSLKSADIVLVDCGTDNINLIQNSNIIKESQTIVLAIINTHNIHEPHSNISLQIGASDYIHMDENTLLENDILFEKKLLEKIHLWSQHIRLKDIKKKHPKKPHIPAYEEQEPKAENEQKSFHSTNIPRTSPKKFDLIVIGVSTGGPMTLVNLLKNLQPLNCPIVIAQHMPKDFTNSLASHLQKETGMNVIEGYHALPLVPQTIIIASGGHDSAIQKIQDGRILLVEKPSNQSCFHPSVDVLFSSAAQANIPTLGIVMTGMGTDGTMGSKNIKYSDGIIIAQDPSTCVVNSMPNSVIKEGYADFVWSPEKISEAISLWCSDKKMKIDEF